MLCYIHGDTTPAKLLILAVRGIVILLVATTIRLLRLMNGDSAQQQSHQLLVLAADLAYVHTTHLLQVITLKKPA